nr:hypothetical protein [Pseudomonadota bacterium]
MAPSSMARVAGRAGPEAPIDLVQLATNTLGNRDLEVQVLHLFKSQSISTLERLKQETDNSVRLDLVHTLKGSARAIGAEQHAEANRLGALVLAGGGALLGLLAVVLWWVQGPVFSLLGASPDVQAMIRRDVGAGVPRGCHAGECGLDVDLVEDRGGLDRV